MNGIFRHICFARGSSLLISCQVFTISCSSTDVDRDPCRDLLRSLRKTDNLLLLLATPSSAASRRGLVNVGAMTSQPELFCRFWSTLCKVEPVNLFFFCKDKRVNSRPTLNHGLCTHSLSSSFLCFSNVIQCSFGRASLCVCRNIHLECAIISCSISDYHKR